jgi:hypothetical protein
MDEETRQKLAARLGLPSDATPEQVTASAYEYMLAEAPTTDDDNPATDDDNPASTDDDASTEDNPAGTEDNPAGTEQQASGPVTLDRGTFEQLKHGAELAAKHERDKEENEIGAMIKEAKMQGHEREQQR